MSGFEPGKDIEVQFVGLRPGEKLFEELITEGEGIVPTSHQKIMALQGETCNLALLNGTIEKLIRSADKQDPDSIKALIKSIVVDYQPYQATN